MRSRVAGVLRLAAINVLVLASLLVVIEGAVSWFLVTRDIVNLVRITDMSLPYTQYDPDLGWVSKKNVTRTNVFGSSAWVQTNGQAFRNTVDIAPAVPPGKFRVICSGDSFTFGDGVDNDHTWCQQLAARDARIEPVNLGEGGYGADQAYLRFTRDTQDLQYQAHVFAFIQDDFVRMQGTKFLGYDKPVLAVEQGKLVAQNVPVPSLASKYPWLVAFPRALNDTRTGALIARMKARKTQTDEAARDARVKQDQQTQAIVKLMFADLKRQSDARGGTLVLMYLCFINDLRAAQPAAWSTFVEQSARELQIPFVNVYADMKAREDVLDLFLPEGSAAGHYSNAGHALVADLLYKQLRESMPAAR